MVLGKYLFRVKSKDCLFLFQAEQQKKAAIITAEGDAIGADLLSQAFKKAGNGLIELRKIEAAEEIAQNLSNSRNVVYLPDGQGVLMNLPAPQNSQTKTEKLKGILDIYFLK